jgi:pyruvate carboxylase
LEPGQEVAADIERGKTLIVRFVALSEADEDGKRKVFFELNGQPRSVRIPDRSKVITKLARPKAESGNTNHVGAPMPGTIGGVRVTAGAKVARGDILLVIEAMKMETSLRAERDATVTEVLTRPGDSVDAKDLLLVLS